MEVFYDVNIQCPKETDAQLRKFGIEDIYIFNNREQIKHLFFLFSRNYISGYP